MDDIDVDVVFGADDDDDDDDDESFGLGSDEDNEIAEFMQAIVGEVRRIGDIHGGSSTKGVKTTTGASAHDTYTVDEHGVDDLASITAEVPELGGRVSIDAIFRESEALLYCTTNPLVQRPQYSTNFGLLLILVLDHVRKTWLRCRITLAHDIVTLHDLDKQCNIGSGIRLRDYVQELCRCDASSSPSKKRPRQQKNKTLSTVFEQCVDFLLTRRNIRFVISDACRAMFKHVPASPELRKALVVYVHRRDDAELREAMRSGASTPSVLQCVERMLYGFLLIYLRIPYTTNFMRALTCSGLMANRALALASPYLASTVLINRQTPPPQRDTSASRRYFPSWMAKQFNVACDANSPDTIAAIAFLDKFRRRDAFVGDNLRRIKAYMAPPPGEEPVGEPKKGDDVLVEHARAYHTLVLEYLSDREVSRVVDTLPFCTSNAQFVQLRTCPLGPINAGVHQSETMFRNVTALSLLNCSIQDEEAVFIVLLEQLHSLHIEDCNALSAEPIRSIHKKYEQQLEAEQQRRDAEEAEDFDDDAFLSRVRMQAGDEDGDDSEVLLPPRGYRPPRYLSLVDNQSMRVYLPHLWRDTLTHLILDRVGIDSQSFRATGVAERLFERLTYLSVIENGGVLNWMICRNLAVLVISQVNGELVNLFRTRIDAEDVCYARMNAPFPPQLLEQMAENSNRFERLHVFTSSIDEKALELYVIEHEELEGVVHTYGSASGDLAKMPRNVTGFYSIDMKGPRFYRLVAGNGVCAV